MNVKLSGANRIPSSLGLSLQKPASAEKYDQKTVQNKNNPMNRTVNDSSETRRQDLALPSERSDKEKERAQSDDKAKHEQNSRVEHNHSMVSKRRKPGKRRRVTVNLAGTKYEVVRKMCINAGFHLAREDDHNCFLHWSDSCVPAERIIELKSFQKINHFPGMGEICRKDSLARNIAKMQKAYPEAYNFTPRTWVIPAEYAAFQTYCRELKKKKRNKVFIMKPASGAMGNGISLLRAGDRIPSHDQIVIQEYLDRPYILEGFKFDLRVYVLVTSCDPLRVFLYNDGLVRLGTEPYEPPTDENLDELFMHLTNYSINKHNENFDRDESIDSGSKRSLQFLNDWLHKSDHDVAFLWHNITDVIIKTLLVAQPHVLHSYRMCRPGQAPGTDSVCFEILGFDIILDSKLRPWLLEVNRAPSFGTDSKLDYDIKSGLLRDTLKLLNIRSGDRRRGIAAEKAEAQKRLLTTPRRSEYTMGELDRKKLVLNKRRLDLKERLTQIRKEAEKEDFENKNMGNFRRIYPPDDRIKAEKYVGLMADAFKLFLSGRAASLQRETTQPFGTLREAEILDLLEQCEADETSSQKQQGSDKILKGPKPLMAMPTAKPVSNKEDSSSTSSSSSTASVNLSTPHVPVAAQTKPSTNSSYLVTKARAQRIITSSSSPPMKFNPVVDAAFLNAVVREREEKQTQRTLEALVEMRIKFPGKTDEEADIILENIQNNWKFHKPRVASYWLVKLDSIKRRKVIDIVRTNVRSILQRVWRSSDVDSLRLCRLFTRVFNRLLWSHGQGLWNCFSNLGKSWETIFSKSTDTLTGIEMTCCRRIVALCRDCLLIVYQFAADTKAASIGDGRFSKTPSASPVRAAESPQRKPPDLASKQVITGRISRLYRE